MFVMENGVGLCWKFVGMVGVSYSEVGGYGVNYVMVSVVMVDVICYLCEVSVVYVSMMVSVVML